jgi:hypothetical protein
MECNISLQVSDVIKSCSSGMFSIQVDEPSDIANLVQLLLCIRYVHSDDTKTEFLFYKPLQSRKSTRYIIVSDYFLEYGIEWKNLYTLSKDGALSKYG